MHDMMRASLYYCLLIVLFLHIILCLAGVRVTTSSTHFPTNGGATIQNPQSLQMNHISNELKGKNKKMGFGEKASKYKKIGSMAPSCERKCYGCRPCEAIQVPTISSRIVEVQLQYTNYEPEGWKCKCGPTFYSP